MAPQSFSFFFCHHLHSCSSTTAKGKAKFRGTGVGALGMSSARRIQSSQDFYFPNICRIHEDLAITNPVILFCLLKKAVEPSRRYLVTHRDVSTPSFTGLALVQCAHFSNTPISTSSKALIVERWMTSLFQFQHMFACLRARNMWISHKLLEFQLGDWQVNMKSHSIS